MALTVPCITAATTIERVFSTKYRSKMPSIRTADAKSIFQPTAAPKYEACATTVAAKAAYVHQPSKFSDSHFCVYLSIYLHFTQPFHSAKPAAAARSGTCYRPAHGIGRICGQLQIIHCKSTYCDFFYKIVIVVLPTQCEIQKFDTHCAINQCKP